MRISAIQADVAILVAVPSLTSAMAFQSVPDAHHLHPLTDPHHCMTYPHSTDPHHCMTTPEPTDQHHSTDTTGSTTDLHHPPVDPSQTIDAHPHPTSGPHDPVVTPHQDVTDPHCATIPQPTDPH